MKYIRTKDGIWKVINEYNNYYLISMENIKEDCYDTPSISKIDVIKQADTIEELCDEFVIKGTRGLYLGIPLQECKLRNIPITQIYGAIWTNAGLNYVAKLNEKGELELL